MLKIFVTLLDQEFCFHKALYASNNEFGNVYYIWFKQGHWIIWFSQMYLCIYPFHLKFLYWLYIKIMIILKSVLIFFFFLLLSSATNVSLSLIVTNHIYFKVSVCSLSIKKFIFCDATMMKKMWLFGDLLSNVLSFSPLRSYFMNNQNFLNTQSCHNFLSVRIQNV